MCYLEESVESRQGPQRKHFKACELGTKLWPILFVTNLQVMILCTICFFLNNFFFAYNYEVHKYLHKSQ